MTIKAPEISHVPHLRALFAEAFDEEEAFLDDFFDLGFSPERSLALFEGEELLSALYWFDVCCRGEKMAYLYAIATRRSSRGRGLAADLIEEAHSRLRALGYRATLLRPASHTLFGYYRRLGYLDATMISEFKCDSRDTAEKLRPVGLEEYLSLRQRMLPEGSVIQTGEMMRLLARGAELYAADGILLAARRQENRLLGIELLGDRSAAPGILAALGCKEGLFRTPGEGLPFSMYFPLSETATRPEYFGIALDV